MCSWKILRACQASVRRKLDRRFAGAREQRGTYQLYEGRPSLMARKLSCRNSQVLKSLARAAAGAFLAWAFPTTWYHVAVRAACASLLPRPRVRLELTLLKLPFKLHLPVAVG